MTAPTATVTVADNSQALTTAAPTHTTNAVEDSTITPAVVVGTGSPAQGWRWTIEGVPVPGLGTADLALADKDVDITFYAPGTWSVVCNARNADGADDSTDDPVTITETNTPYTDLAKIEPPADRVSPLVLPDLYRDPTVATPGLPTVSKYNAARMYGSILPEAARPTYSVVAHVA